MNLRNIPEAQALEVLTKDNPDLLSLLQIYPKEAIATLTNNKDKLHEITLCMNNASAYASINALVMTCKEGCPYSSICVFAKNSMQPTSFSCPLEKKIVSQLEADIRITLDIDSNNPIEMEMLWDLIDAKLLDMRASAALKDGKLVQIVEQKIGPQTVSREELSPNMEAKFELKKIKASIIDAFVASRRSKKKYGMNSDASTLETLIMKAAQNVRNEKDD
jgi:hypothetical protein